MNKHYTNGVITMPFQKSVSITVFLNMSILIQLKINLLQAQKRFLDKCKVFQHPRVFIRWIFPSQIQLVEFHSPWTRSYCKRPQWLANVLVTEWTTLVLGWQSQIYETDLVNNNVHNRTNLISLLQLSFPYNFHQENQPSHFFKCSLSFILHLKSVINDTSSTLWLLQQQLAHIIATYVWPEHNTDKLRSLLKEQSVSK